MAAEKPRPGRSHGPGPGIYDHTLWTLLRALVSHRPALPASVGISAPASHDLSPRQLRQTTGDLAAFAHKIGELLELPHAPDGPGSARAVARIVARMCLECAQRWSRDGEVTRSRTRDFEREVTVLESALDSIATRAPK